MAYVEFDGKLDGEESTATAEGFLPFDGELDPPTRTWGEAASDTAVQLGEGVNTIIGAVPNLVAPESGAAKFFNENAEYWRGQQSDALKSKIATADQAITAAGEDGIISQITEAARQYFSDPALAARFVTTNLPSMIPGIGAAKVAQAAALAKGATAIKAAGVATTAAGATNAVLNAGGARGEAFEDIKSTLIQQGMTPDEAEEQALKDSRVVAAIGGLTGYFSGKTGLEKAIVGGAAKGGLRAGVGSAVTELAGEQLEEVAPKLATNVQASQYDNRSIGQDVGRTIVETAIASGPGGVVSGVAAASKPTVDDIAAASTVDEAIAAATAVVEAPVDVTPADSLIEAVNPYDVGGFVTRAQAGEETDVDTPQRGLFGGGGEVAAPELAQAAEADRQAESQAEFDEFLRKEQIDATYLRQAAIEAAQKARAFDLAEQQRREADIPAMQQEAANQRVEQAEAITNAQGFDTAEPTAMQLAMQRAQERRKLAVTPVSQRAQAQPEGVQLQQATTENSSEQAIAASGNVQPNPATRSAVGAESTQTFSAQGIAGREAGFQPTNAVQAQAGQVAPQTAPIAKPVQPSADERPALNTITVYRGRQKGQSDKPATWWTASRDLAEHFSRYTPKSGNKTVDTGEVVESVIDRAGVLDTKWHAYDIKTIKELSEVSGVEKGKFINALKESDDSLDKNLAEAGDMPWRAHAILERGPVQKVLREAGFTHIQAIEGRKGEEADTFLKLPEKSTITPDVKTQGAQPDRRQDLARRRAVAEMSPDEMRQALLTSEKTGIPNLRAFEERIQTNPQDKVLYGDLDDFKAMNTKLGHDGADQVLRAVGAVKAQIAERIGVNPYHRSGDEFLATGLDDATLNAYGKAVQDELAKATFQITMPNGRVVTQNGVGFSYGTGQNTEFAEARANEQKAERKRLGLRSGQRDVVEAPERGGQDNEDNAVGRDGTPAQPEQVTPPEEEAKQRRAERLREVTTPVSRRGIKPVRSEALTPVSERGKKAEEAAPTAKPEEEKKDEQDKDPFTGTILLHSGLSPIEAIKNIAEKLEGNKKTPDEFKKSARQSVSKYREQNKRIREEHVATWDKSKKWLKRQLAPGGLLPKSVFDEKIKRDSEFEAIEFDVKHIVGQFERALKEEYGATVNDINEKSQRLLSDAMAGRVSNTLKEKTKTALLGMRQYIDGLSLQYMKALAQQQQDLLEQAERTGDERLIAEANEKASLIETIMGNVGAYVHRSYRAFDDPKWANKVPDEVLDAAREYLIARHEELGEKKAKQRAEIIINEILKHGTAYDSMESFIKESKLGAKDLSVLKTRKEIAPEIRALLGEYTDPRINFAKSATKMGRLIWNQAFLDHVRKIGVGQFLFDDNTKPPEATAKIAGDTSDVYAPLNGLWTTPEVNQAFKDALGKEQMAEWYKKIVQINGMIKYGKTVLSVTTSMRNWMSAYLFTVANGHFDLTHMKKSVDGIKEYFAHGGDAKKMAYLRELKQLGVVYDTPYAGEMMRLLADSNLSETLLIGKTKLKVKHALDMATKFYQYGDDFWKIIGFENEKRMWMDVGLSEQDAKVKAAERIRNTYPTYSMIGRGIQSLRRFPLVGTFVSFPAEIIRTSYNMVRYIAEDYKDPKTKKMALRRAAGLTIAGSFAYAAQALSMAMLGYDDEDDEAVRQMAAPWQKNSSFIFTGRDAKGNLRYLDISFLDPYNYWKRPIIALTRGQPVDTAIKEALTEVLKPFFGADIAAENIFQVLANKKSTGSQIYKEHDDATNQFLDIADHLRKALQPGTFSNIEKTWRALAGETKPSGQKYEIRDELAAWVGFRMSTLDPKVALYYRSFDFKDAKAEAEKSLRDAIRDPNEISSKDLRKAYDLTLKLRKEAYSDMHTLITAARRSGMSNQQISEVLKNSGLSDQDTGYLKLGKTPKWKLSDEAIERDMKKARSMFGQDASKRVRERYREVLSYGEGGSS